MLIVFGGLGSGLNMSWPGSLCLCFPENNFKVDGLASSWRSLIIVIIISPLFCKEALLFMSTFPPRAGGGGCGLFLEVSFLLSANQSSFY